MAIKQKPRGEWSREEAEFVDNNVPSEIKRDIADYDKEKLEKHNQKTAYQKVIKDRKGKITELEAAAAHDALYVRELDHTTGQYQYFMVSNKKP